MPSENPSAAIADSEALSRQRAARLAWDFVRPGARIGLGTGSTAEAFMDILAAEISSGFSIECVPTSLRTQRQAESRGIPMVELGGDEKLDLVIDGADEVDIQLDLIKGGGGALLREKIVAVAASKKITIVTAGKKVSFLGAFPLPVEIEPFGIKGTLARIEELLNDLNYACKAVLRETRSDGGHFLADLPLGQITDKHMLASGLAGTPGVIEHGLFLDMADEVVVGRPGAGESYVLTRA